MTVVIISLLVLVLLVQLATIYGILYIVRGLPIIQKQISAGEGLQYLSRTRRRHK